MSLQNHPTTTAVQEVDLFGFLGFDDPLKPASNGLGFDRVDPGGSNPSCQERSSCPAADSVAPRSPNDIIYRNCYCDDVCQSYDDCCQDYVRHPQATVETVHLQPEVIGCQPPGVRFKDRGFLNRLVSSKWSFAMINRCPRDYNEPFIAAKCELGNDPSSDLFYRVPVNGKSSKLLYLNYYCALCNGAGEVVFWSGHLDVCTIFDGKDEDERLRRIASVQTMELVRNNSHCELTFDFPEGYPPRPCKNVTRRCSDGWTGAAETVRKCQDRTNSTSYVYYRQSGPIYRNRHCAVCNYVNDTDTTCVDPTVPSDHSPPFHIPPFSVLVDLNSETLVLERKGDVHLQNQTRVELRRCDIGSVYDPFKAVCRPVFCRKDYVLTDSGCVPSNTDPETGLGPKDLTTHHRTEDSGQLDCDQRISLNQSEYRIFDNHTLYVYHLNDWYDKGSYLVADTNTSVMICSPFSGRQYNVTVYEQVVMFHFDQTQSLLSVIGVVVSLASLMVLFVVYMALPVMRNTPGKCVICLISSLFVGQLCYLFVWFRRSPVCFYQAAAMHFGYLAAFFWTNVLAFDICRAFMSTTATTITESGSHSKRFILFSLYAWTLPAAIVAVCVALDVMDLDESFRPHYGEVACWIASKTSLLVFFVVPVGVILIVNVVFFVMAVYCICRASLAAESATPASHTKGQLLVYIKLSFIMGLTWVFGLLATLSRWIVLWYAFICLNSLQGAFLALVFICTKKVYRQMKAKWSTNSATNSTISNTENKSNRKLISAVNETALKKEKSKIISKETCM